MASLGFSFINGDHNVARMRVISKTLRKSWLGKIKSDTPSFLSLGEWSTMIEACAISGYIHSTDGALMSIFAHDGDVWDAGYGMLTLLRIKRL